MLQAVLLDSIFGLTVFAETLAALSLLLFLSKIPPGGALDPILFFYKSHIVPVIAAPANLAGAPGWYMDAYVLSLVLFFLFFIKQARIAMAPYGEALPTPSLNQRVTHAEASLDAALPPVFCAIGALLASLTLLPLLTPVAAIWLRHRKSRGKSTWFEISPFYYVNLFAVAGIAGLIMSLIGLFR
jgi:hypothetical protein